MRSFVSSSSHLPKFASTANQSFFTRIARPALKLSAALWFLVAVLGQLIFVVYIFGFYGRAALQGNFQAWNNVMPRGYVPGDTVGNIAISVHLLFAAAITLAGAAQLTPQLRTYAPRLHRWIGRGYISAAVLMSVSGLLMVWTRSTVGDLSQHIAISLNALMILVSAGLTLRYAMARRIDVHRRWALRLFVSVSGVWFFRIGLMLWIVLNQGPAGFDPKTFTGPFLTCLAFGVYVVVPWALLELYLRAQASRNFAAHLAMAGGLALITLLMVLGIASATLLMWLPHL